MEKKNDMNGKKHINTYNFSLFLCDPLKIINSCHPSHNSPQAIRVDNPNLFKSYHGWVIKCQLDIWDLVFSNLLWKFSISLSKLNTELPVKATDTHYTDYLSIFNLDLLHFSSSRILVVTLTSLDSDERQVTIGHSVVTISQSNGHDEDYKVCLSLYCYWRKQWILLKPQDTNTPGQLIVTQTVSTLVSVISG